MEKARNSLIRGSLILLSLLLIPVLSSCGGDVASEYEELVGGPTPSPTPTIPDPEPTPIPTPVEPPPPGLPDGDLPIEGDLSFDPLTLPTELSPWYTRMGSAMGSAFTQQIIWADTGDLWTYGTDLGDQVAGLVMALRATGDLGFLNRIVDILDRMDEVAGDTGPLRYSWSCAGLPDCQVDLCDAGSSTYLHWFYLQGDAGYHCKDTHEIATLYAHGIVALAAYALHQNRILDEAAYGPPADYWTNYLVNHFLPRWAVLGGHVPDDVAGALTELYRRFTYPVASRLRISYYLWKITGEDVYRLQAESDAGLLLAHFELNPDIPSAYRWKSNVSGTDNGWQKVIWGQGVTVVTMELAAEKFAAEGGSDPFYPVTEMERFMSTFRDYVFPKDGSPYNQMAYRVYGDELDLFNMYSLAGLARWDDTGFLLGLATDKFVADESGVLMAAGALYGLSPR